MARMRVLALTPALCAAIACAAAPSALAHETRAAGAPTLPYAWPGYPPPPGAVPMAGAPYAPAPYAYAPPQADPEYQRMLDRCRVAERDSGTGGALIGGAVGGLLGNRVAGSGNRTVGTIAGAAVGAVAGAVIDKAEDKTRERECQEFFRRTGAGAWPAAPYGGYGPYGAPYGYMMVPVTMVPGRQEPCVETTTVTEEYVPTVVRSRTIPRRAAPRTKRVKEKRVYTGS